MKKALCLLIFCLPPILLHAQSDTSNGIHWCEDLSWDQAKAKAKKENKYLFVDCYATWCQPCKQMDKDVYTSESVGNYINEKFVAIKVQMDKTQSDNEQVKRWYPDAAMIASNFNVQAFPTFIFFDTNGTPVHKAVGYHNVDNFISLLKDAFNSTKQYYTLLRDFVPGTIDTGELKGLARAFEFIDPDLSGKMAEDYFMRIPSQELGNYDNISLMAELQNSRLVEKIAFDYIVGLDKKNLISPNNIQLICWLNKQSDIQNFVDKFIIKLNRSEIGKPEIIKLMIAFKDNPNVISIAKDYIEKLVKREMLLKKNIELLGEFTNSSNDKGFNFFYYNANEIDSLMWKNYTQSVIDKVVDKEEIFPVVKASLKNKVEPNWDSLVLAIEKKYPNPIYGERNVLWAKLNWYRVKGSTSQYIKFTIVFFDKYLDAKDNSFRENLKRMENGEPTWVDPH